MTWPDPRRLGRWTASAQGAYYALTGLWSLVSLSTFQWVTGPKTDTWLVQTVGALVLAIALPLLVAAARRDVGLELRMLGALSALAFFAVDVTFYLQGRIRAIYLADAAAELVLLGLWTLASVRSSEPRSGGLEALRGRRPLF
jgi:hypothetical protein